MSTWNRKSPFQGCRNIPSLCPGIHTSPLGVIPKKNKPGKWHLIVDLSSPIGSSVNNRISQEPPSLRYISLDHLASMVNLIGRGALMVKADIKEDYRMIPIHSHDQHLLGVWWNDYFYVDRMLPSASILLQRYSQWWQMDFIGFWLSMVLLTSYTTWMILFLWQPPWVRPWGRSIPWFQIFNAWEFPLSNPNYMVGPSNGLTFLGIQINTEVLLLRIRLPQVLLAQLKQELSHCILWKAITKRELQSLTDLLQFATKVIRPGRPFIRQLYTIQSIGSHPDHHICLNSTARADIIIMVVPVYREMEWYFLTLG